MEALKEKESFQLLYHSQNGSRVWAGLKPCVQRASLVSLWKAVDQKLWAIIFCYLAR